MKVYELIQKLLEAPAGANVYIKISEQLHAANQNEDLLMNRIIMADKWPTEVFLTTK